MYLTDNKPKLGDLREMSTVGARWLRESIKSRSRLHAKGRLMASLKPPTKSLQPDELELLGQTFNAVWATIETSELDRDLGKDEELRTAVSKRLCALAAGGVTDPELLRELTLASILRAPQRSRVKPRAK
jgi:hypothetical protein